MKMKTIQEKIERMDLTMARRPKGNYEVYIRYFSKETIDFRKLAEARKKSH